MTTHTLNKTNSEKFKKIEGHTDYLISNLGRVISTKFGKIKELKIGVSGQKYAMIQLCTDGKREHLYVHRLVGEYFIKKIEGKDQIGHNDGNKLNNRVNNLCWQTQKENLEHAVLTKLRKRGFYAKNRKVKVTNFGQTIEFNTLAKAAKFLEVSVMAIWNCCNQKQKTVKQCAVQYV